MTIEAANPPITTSVEPATLPTMDALGGEFVGWISEVVMSDPMNHSWTMMGWSRYERARNLALLNGDFSCPIRILKMRILSGVQKLCFWAQAELAHSKPKQCLFSLEKWILGIR
jgi:hypothetical protein